LPITSRQDTSEMRAGWPASNLVRRSVSRRSREARWEQSPGHSCFVTSALRLLGLAKVSGFAFNRILRVALGIGHPLRSLSVVYTRCFEPFAYKDFASMVTVMVSATWIRRITGAECLQLRRVFREFRKQRQIFTRRRDLQDDRLRRWC